MGRIDLICGEYFEDDSRFADVMNFALYDGRAEIKAEELQEIDSDIYVAPHTAGKRGSVTVFENI